MSAGAGIESLGGRRLGGPRRSATVTLHEQGAEVLHSTVVPPPKPRFDRDSKSRG